MRVRVRTFTVLERLRRSTTHARTHARTRARAHARAHARSDEFHFSDQNAGLLYGRAPSSCAHARAGARMFVLSLFPSAWRMFCVLWAIPLRCDAVCTRKSRMPDETKITNKNIYALPYPSAMGGARSRRKKTVRWPPLGDVGHTRRCMGRTRLAHR